MILKSHRLQLVLKAGPHGVCSTGEREPPKCWSTRCALSAKGLSPSEGWVALVPPWVISAQYLRLPDHAVRSLPQSQACASQYLRLPGFQGLIDFAATTSAISRKLIPAALRFARAQKKLLEATLCARTTLCVPFQSTTRSVSC